ncbi:hypothetical protein C8F04DRAFT_1257049 [Mycena alexandri]|uniref:Uncharacterized protein n=1 Tax=Mycena alexandri TaxID=1745969 RepID=A0AAD6T173_9AGAR|nr:hypothetical protein C8F04DRAFT_1257049 [Mycena alexandri]
MDSRSLQLVAGFASYSYCNLSSCASPPLLTAETSETETVSAGDMVHSECQLIASLAATQDTDIFGDEVQLVRCIGSSKLHCPSLACYLWLRAFGKEHEFDGQLVANDGSHGAIEAGWLAPRLPEPAHSATITKMNDGLQRGTWDPDLAEDEEAMLGVLASAM